MRCLLGEQLSMACSERYAKSPSRKEVTQSYPDLAIELNHEQLHCWCRYFNQHEVKTLSYKRYKGSFRLPCFILAISKQGIFLYTVIKYHCFIVLLVWTSFRFSIISTNAFRLCPAVDYFNIFFHCVVIRHLDD